MAYLSDFGTFIRDFFWVFVLPALSAVLTGPSVCFVLFVDEMQNTYRTKDLR